jgi:AcrR family transcriptional regulator
MEARTIDDLEQFLGAAPVAARGGMAEQRHEHQRRGPNQDPRKRSVAVLLHTDQYSCRMSEAGRHLGRSVRKTREAILATFNGLVLKGRYADLNVRELARKAGVGRSTFYHHFDDKTALLVESLDPLLSVLAHAAAGKNAPQLPRVLAHFEEQRANALRLFRSATERAALEGALANIVKQQVPRGAALPSEAIASTLSRMTIGLIADWLAADRRSGCDEFAAVLAKTALACRGALLG